MSDHRNAYADLAKADAKRMRAFKHAIELASAATDMKPSILAGIISRETRGWPVYAISPKAGGRLGDNGHGHGPMQIDDRSFPDWCADWRNGKWSATDAVDMGARILRQKMKRVRVLTPVVDEETLLRLAVSAYNCGEGRVAQALKEGLDIDHYTTGKDYSRDVLARAAWFRDNGYGDGVCEP